MDYAGNEPYSTAGAEVLPVRETENLVPVSFCKDVYRGNDDMQMRIDTVLRVADQEQGSGVRPADYVLRYLDLKRGFAPSKINREASQEAKDFLVRAWRLLSPAETDFDFKDIDDGGDVIWQGFGEAVLRNVVECGQSAQGASQLRAGCKKSPFFGELREIVSRLLALSACMTRSYT